MGLLKSHLAHIFDAQIAYAYERRMCPRYLNFLGCYPAEADDLPLEIRMTKFKGGLSVVVFVIIQGEEIIGVEIVISLKVSSNVKS